MQTGKLTPEQLRQHVLKYLGAPTPHILVSAELGGDVTLLKTPKAYTALSTDPITGATDHAGWMAVHVTANDVFASGADPMGCLLTILAPPDSSLDDIEQVMRDADRAAKELGIAICGGHTEVTDAVNRLVLSATVIGSMSSFDEEGAKPQPCDDIVVCKSLGLEGSSIIARDHVERIRSAFTPEEIERLASMVSEISVAQAARAAVKHGAVHAMHDITEGGLLGALYEMAEGAGLGFELNGAAIPLHPLVERLCHFLRLDPLRLLSSGSLLIASPKGAELADKLRQLGFIVTVAGRFTEQKTHLLFDGTHKRSVEPPQSDELWRLMALWDEERTL